MTQQEQAKDLVDKFLKCKDVSNSYYVIPIMEDAKQCALIAVDFAMNSKYSFQPMHGGWVSGKSYYEELKQEIEKL